MTTLINKKTTPKKEKKIVGVFCGKCHQEPFGFDRKKKEQFVYYLYQKCSYCSGTICFRWSNQKLETRFN